jgi:hypothetical protein
VLIKGHYEETWAGISNNHSGYDLFNDTSSTTIIHAAVYNISAGGMVDVQVRALIGKFVTVYDPPVPALNVIPSHEIFVGAASDWSTIKTITIHNVSTNTISPSPSSFAVNSTNFMSQNPMLTSNQSVIGGSTLFGLDLLAIVLVVLLVLVVVLLVFVVFYLRRRSAVPQPVLSASF